MKQHLDFKQTENFSWKEIKEKETSKGTESYRFTEEKQSQKTWTLDLKKQ